jgi:peptidoglycan/xylan/chitin deacetylase (PgdA/CDA1 family)
MRKANRHVTPRNNSRVRQLLGFLDPTVGRLSLTLRRRRDEGVIVLYHRVSREPNLVYEPLHPDEFERHCELLTRWFSVIPLAEMLERQRRGMSLAGLCSITFDDGYLDFRDHALPILQSHELGATLFVITRCVDTGEAPWDLRLRRILLQSPETGPPEGLFKRLNAMPVAERGRWLDEHEAELGSAGELYDLPRMLTASDLAAMPASIEIGSHTASHRVLGGIEPDLTGAELSESLARLRELDHQVSLVAYPRGSTDAAVEEAAQEAGYAAALAVGNRAVDWRSDPFALPRFDVTDRPAEMLRVEIGGVVEPLRRLRKRVRARLSSRPSAE